VFRAAKRVLTALAVIAIILLAYQFFFARPVEITKGEEYHTHADFAVFLNGQKLNFSKKEFMSKETCGKPGEEHKIDLNTEEGMAEAAHLHDLNGNVVHFHHENATLAMFFGNIGFSLSKDCLETKENKYCNTDFKKLKVFANGLQVINIENYVPKDLDKLLVTYGEESASEVRAQNEQITSQACIYSKKCPIPSGFVLPPEACT